MIEDTSRIHNLLQKIASNPSLVDEALSVGPSGSELFFRIRTHFFSIHSRLQKADERGKYTLIMYPKASVNSLDQVVDWVYGSDPEPLDGIAFHSADDFGMERIFEKAFMAVQMRDKQVQTILDDVLNDGVQTP